jgi:hypothetical protein
MFGHTFDSIDMLFVVGTVTAALFCMLAGAF